MPFLSLNGWTIPILKGGEVAPLIIGDRGRSFNGTLNDDRRVIKDAWRFETKELSDADATALVGLLLGRGDSWPYDSDLYSSKGLGYGSTFANLVPGVALGDGLLVYDGGTGESESKFGAGSIAVEAAAINILPTNSRDAEAAPSGYTAVGGAGLASDTAHYIQGTRGLEVTAGGAAQGAITDSASCATGTAYVASLYVYAAAGDDVTIELVEDATTSLANETFSLTGGQWSRISVTGTTSGGASTVEIRITATSGAYTFTCDMFQIELGTVMSSWYDGSRAAADLAYSVGFMGSAGFTFSSWVRMPTASVAADRYVMRLGSTLTSVIWRNDLTNSVYFYLKGSDGSAVTLSNLSSPWDDAWHHVAGVVSGDRMSLYFDGVEVDSSTSFDHPTWADLDTLYVGNGIGSRIDTGSLMDEVVLLPYAASASLVAALAGRSVAVPGQPRLLAEGDCVNEPAGVQVEARVPGSTYRGVTLSGTWDNTARRVRFELEEV